MPGTQHVRAAVGREASLASGERGRGRRSGAGAICQRRAAAGARGGRARRLDGRSGWMVRQLDGAAGYVLPVGAAVQCGWVVQVSGSVGRALRIGGMRWSVVLRIGVCHPRPARPPAAPFRCLLKQAAAPTFALVQVKNFDVTDYWEPKDAKRYDRCAAPSVASQPGGPLRASSERWTQRRAGRARPCLIHPLGHRS